MTLQNLDFGTAAPNDGETLSSAFTKIQANFVDLYASGGTVTHAVTDVASATTCDIGAAATDRVRITGTTTITSLGTSASKLRFVEFAAALTLTYNATSLILPGAANITTSAGDCAIFSSDASGNWRCLVWQDVTGRGNVTGPSSATDNAIARFDGTTGELIQNSGVVINDSDVVSGLTALTMSGADTTASPSLNSSLYIELTNTTGSGSAGGQLRFGKAAGNPYAMISSSLLDGTPPGSGYLAFATRNDSGNLQNRLWMTPSSGTLVSADDPTDADAIFSANFSAYNSRSQQNFIGYTRTSDAPSIASCISFYGVADNDDTLGGGVTAWGAYLEGRAGNQQLTFGAEIDVENTTTDEPGTPSPNDMFATARVGPICYAIWSQANGTVAGATKDASAWMGVIGGADGGGGLRFKKGIVFSQDVIATVSSHKEAINFGANQEVVWYASGGSTARLYSDGSALTSSVPFTVGTSNPITAGTIELGAASDTTISRASAGIVAVEGVNLVNLSASQTLTNKTLTSPTLTTPDIGVATATSVNKVAITAPATSATLTIANGKTLTASNTLTLTATDGSTLAVGGGGTLGTAAYVNTGTNGGVVPLLNGTNIATGDWTFSKATVNLTLNKSASGQQVNIYSNMNNLNRWVLQFGNEDAESGANAGSNFRLLNYDDAGGFLSAVISVQRVDGSVTFGNPTGGFKGAGTLNAKAVYDDNVLLTDYVFDKYFGGATFAYSDRVQSAYDKFDPSMFELDSYAAYFTENHRLWGMPDLNDCIDGLVKDVSLGGMVHLLWQTAELQAIHDKQLNDRIKHLETRIRKLETPQ